MRPRGERFDNVTYGVAEALGGRRIVSARQRESFDIIVPLVVLKIRERATLGNVRPKRLA